MRIVTVLVELALALALPLNGASIPASGKLSFDVICKGKDIGDHSYEFSGSTQSASRTITPEVIERVKPT